jgi:hypothetical protein
MATFILQGSSCDAFGLLLFALAAGVLLDAWGLLAVVLLLPLRRVCRVIFPIL